MTVVVDASTIVAAFTDAGPVGAWADSLLGSEPLAAPHLMPAEVTNMLRRSVLSGDLAPDAVARAYANLASLRVHYYPYAPYAARIWELRANVTPYDAWYVALAEALDAPLATADGHLIRATGAHCRFITPPV